MKNYCNCEACDNKGFIETLVYYSHKVPNGTLTIEKCDDCNVFISDFIAAKFASWKYCVLFYVNAYGVNIKIN